MQNLEGFFFLVLLSVSQSWTWTQQGTRSVGRNRAAEVGKTRTAQAEMQTRRVRGRRDADHFRVRGRRRTGTSSKHLRRTEETRGRERGVHGPLFAAGALAAEHPW